MTERQGPKGFFITPPDDATRERLRNEVIRRAKTESLRLIGHDLRLHPKILRTMLGIKVPCLNNHDRGAMPINYVTCEKRWRERVEDIGPVWFLNVGAIADCGRPPVVETIVERHG